MEFYLVHYEFTDYRKEISSQIRIRLFIPSSLKFILTRQVALLSLMNELERALNQCGCYCSHLSQTRKFRNDSWHALRKHKNCKARYQKRSGSGATSCTFPPISMQFAACIRRTTSFFYLLVASLPPRLPLSLIPTNTYLMMTARV